MSAFNEAQLANYWRRSKFKTLSLRFHARAV